MFDVGRAAVALATLLVFAGSASIVRAAEAPPLGAADFAASADRPLGWRGDGSGRYPGATPPTTWERKRTGEGYATKGIAWMAPLPNGGVSSPIVVGDRIFLTAEPCDLVCLDKKSGRVLWIRSNAEFEGLTDDERKTDPAFAEKLAPLAAELVKANQAVVEALNARQPTAAAADSPRQPDAATKKKREIEKQILDGQLAIDKKRFTRYWGQAVFGFSGPTPTSDGKRVFAFFTTGVSACYDLEGNRQWIARGGGGGSEHGNFASPILCGDRLVVWASEMRAYDVATGKLAWTNPAKAFNTYGSLFRVRSGDEMVACFQWGFFTRVRDGKPVWDQGIFGDSVTTPIAEGDVIIGRVGYPKANDKTQSLRAFKVPPNTDGGKLAQAREFKVEWTEEEISTDKDKAPFARGYVASPLLVDGLIYQVTQGGGLVVHDAATGDLVYKKVLPLNPRTHYWDWAGCSISPTLAGKHIYLMDNQGGSIVIQPGREYKAIAQNKLEELKDNKDQVQFLGTPAFEGERMYLRTPGFLYCIDGK